ncbi:MAG TPA: sulfotransferase family 2 domain-containing protein [Chthoniobacterales bacterium]|nr:sulfotransferase family 2 domain-containing protein [Chthoniobacterales bacterium]
MSGQVGYIPAFSMSPSARTLLFLHIPKTGGTTFRRILECNYARNEILTLNGADHSAERERFANSAEASRRRYRAVQGHLYFGFHQFVPSQSAYVTWMRDPVARSLSFYSHVCNRTDHYLHRQLKEQRLNLKGLLAGKVTPELFNLQTRMIAGEQNHAATVDRNTLEIAKQNLRKDFCFVGLTEQFDAGLVMLSEMLGWSRPFYTRENVGIDRVAPECTDAETESLLREANELDFELHHFARDLFETRRKAAGPSFESKLTEFQQLNATGASVRRPRGRMKTALLNALTRRGARREVAALKQSPAARSI